ALAFSSTNLEPLTQLSHAIPPAELASVVAGLGDRFSGNPEKSSYLASLRARSQAGSPDDGLAHLRELAEHGDRSMMTYLQLGDAEIKLHGGYDAASQAFLRYPAFHDANPADAVGLSNDAEFFGSRLYSLGRPELA